ncbi:hypothetical protein JWJ88_17160 [Paracoccus methylovorus]|uniref:Uncharacterized protein n=1 Tax=Paracoccus methylovorus TaxID=2812658 RepID=A0ABX7JKF3_9RHOB|nr:hypothetical protein [Paracoccus methylovorus]QRZ14693.1 hypothetical protein JWJ88_17160 [Paracoccus methylovorus]
MTTTPTVADLVAVNLLPCPFCGGPMEDRGYGAVHLDPQKCPIGDLAVDIARWNTRALSPAATEPAGEAEPVGCGLPCGYDCNGACFDPSQPSEAVAQGPDAVRHSFDGDGWLYSDHGNGSDWLKRAMLYPDAEPLYAAPPSPVTVETEDLHDFATHREAWRHALELCKDRSYDIADVTYWEHELRAFDRAFIALRALAGENRDD